MAVNPNWQKFPRLKQHRFSGDLTAYIAPSFAQLEALTYHVSRQVLACGEHFDLIVTLAKGGWAMTRSLVDFTQIGTIASIGAKFYIGIGQKMAKPQIYQDLPISIADKSVLIFDDVADSGGSLMFVKKLLEERGAQSVRTATLFYKPKSVIKPDFFAYQTSAWILFPFERVEMGQLLTQKWLEQGIEPVEIRNRVQKLKLIIGKSMDSYER